MNPKVTVVIPAYNAESYIEETIRTALNQKFTDFEIIVVNDGSTDGTVEIINGLKEERVKTINVENGGVSTARNMGFKHALGEYIAFLDADDVWDEDNLLSKVEFLDKNPTIGLVHSDARIINQHSIDLGDVLLGKEGDILNDLLSWNGTCIPGPSSVLVRKSVLNQVGLFDPQISTSADKDFFFRVAQKFPIGRIPRITWSYRIHDNNMHSNIERMQKDEIYVYRKASENNLFHSAFFEANCFSKMYKVLSGSWWVNKRNFRKAATCYFLSVWVYFPIILKWINK